MRSLESSNDEQHTFRNKSRFRAPSRGASASYCSASRYNSDSVVQKRYTIGGEGGHAFDVNAIAEGEVVIKIEVWPWSKHDTLRCAKFYFSDGTTGTCGVAAGKSLTLEMNYESGERVVGIRIYPNGAGTRIARIVIKTNKGQEFMPTMKQWKRHLESGGQDMEVGSGIILGAIGRGGGDIDNLGFLMLREIEHVSIVGVRYDMEFLHEYSPMKVTAVSTVIPNPSDENSVFWFGVKKVNKTGGHWEITDGNTLGLTTEASVGAAVPSVARALLSASCKWETSVERQYQSSWSSEVDFTCKYPLHVPKQTKMHVTIEYYEGQAKDIPFSARMRYRLSNGETFSAPVRGVYSGIDNTNFIGDCKLLATWESNKWVPTDEG